MSYKRTVGVSLVSILPLSFLPGVGLRAVLRVLKEADLGGVQLLPFKTHPMFRLGNNFLVFKKFPQQAVISFEGDWNSGPFMEMIKRMRGKAGEEAPSGIDWLIFGNSNVNERLNLIKQTFPDAIHVTHAPDASNGSMLEISPELGWELGDFLRFPGKLVFDTFHARRPGRNGENPVSTDPLGLIRSLVKNGKVGLIHFQPLRDDGGRELQEFMSGESNILTDMLQILGRVRPRIPVIIETLPSLVRGASVSKTADFFGFLANYIRNDLS